MALLEIKNLAAGFDTPQGFMRAVDGMDISIGKGEVVGLVGESGCGKSTVAFSILRLLPHPTGQIVSGEILFEDGGTVSPLSPSAPNPSPNKNHFVNLVNLDEKHLCAIRGKEISMIFQEPMSALNPVMRIGDQVAESLILHDKVDKKNAFEAVRKMLLRVGLSEEKANGRHYPHELSGGERQRVMIAMALICKPKLIIADEPTTALDASLQTQILELLSSLQKETGASILFITHDLGLVRRFCDRVYVMYAGLVVEHGKTRDVFEFPRHPYTRALLDSRKSEDIQPKTPLRSIEGRLPTFWEWEGGCRFAPRCSFAKELCKKPQELLPTLTTHARCCRWSEVGAKERLSLSNEKRGILIVSSCFLVKKKGDSISELCLGLKQRGFGQGKWEAVGGKLEENETVEAATKREALEELNITIENMEPAGVINAHFVDDPAWGDIRFQMHIFVSDKWQGTPQRSDELEPRWFAVDKIPYENMWPDNKIWLPLLLQNKRFRGEITYNREASLVQKEFVELIADKERPIESPITPTCFCFLVKKEAGMISQVCLGLKKRGFAKGKWLSLGGKVDSQETSQQAAKREAYEEAGVTIQALEAVGTLTYRFIDDAARDHLANIYICDSWTGEPRESEEAIPKWYPIGQIPYDKMWPDNKLWLPLLLEGKSVNGTLVYNKEHILLKQELKSQKIP